MNYKEISADEYEKLLQNKKNIFNNTFKNTNKLEEDKKKFLESDPDTIIEKQQKDDYIEKLSDLISKKINNTDDLKNISDKIDFKKITDEINLTEISDKIDLKNEETSRPSYENDYVYYMKNPNILADKIVELYDNNLNASPIYPKNKENNVKIHKLVKKINDDPKIGEQYQEFVKEFRNIHKNTFIEYDYQTYKNLILDRINKKEVSTSDDNISIKEVSTSNDDSFIKNVGKEFIKNLKGQGLNEYKTIKIDKDALKKNILKIRNNNNGRKVINKYLHDDMFISNNKKNAIMKNTNINKLSKNEYHVYTLLNKYKNDDTNLLISSFLAGNNSTDSYNTINRNLYHKLKNNELSKQNYHNIFKKISTYNI